MSIEVRGAVTPAEVEAAVRVLDSVLGSGRGSRDLDLFRASPDLLSIALEDGWIVGSVGCDGANGVGTVAVLEGYRGQGLGRRLLERAEDVLRQRGAKSVGLGSLDGAVDFYLSCGYQAQLLVQFAPEVDQPELIITELINGVLAGHQVARRDW
ncbi:putative N-acetyltransferase YhbS, partial [Microlunatus parietis]